MGYFCLFYTLTFIYSLKYEAFIRNSAWSLGHSDSDTSSVLSFWQEFIWLNILIFRLLQIPSVTSYFRDFTRFICIGSGGYRSAHVFYLNFVYIFLLNLSKFYPDSIQIFQETQLIQTVSKFFQTLTKSQFYPAFVLFSQG